MANSFVEPVDQALAVKSTKIEEESASQGESHETEWTNSFVWTSPTYRKQSENLVCVSSPPVQHAKLLPAALKSKSQQKKRRGPERDAPDVKPVVVEAVGSRQDALQKLAGSKDSSRSPTFKCSLLEVTVEAQEKPRGRLSELEETILKNVQLLREREARKRSRFGFCKQGNSPKESPTPKEPSLVMSFLKPEVEIWREMGAETQRSRIAQLLSQKLTFTQF